MFIFFFVARLVQWPWSLVATVVKSLANREMSRGFSHPSSSCSCGSRNHSVSSPGSVSGTPHCHCGEIAVLRVARTAKNCGKQFWGYPLYKVWYVTFIFVWAEAKVWKIMFALFFVNSGVLVKISKSATTSNGARKIMGMKEMQPLLDRVKEYVNWRKIWLIPRSGWCTCLG